MLSPHLLSTHLLTTHLLSNSFAINSVVITFICYQASFSFRPQLLLTHLLSGQFAINPQLQSTILLSIIISYQIFDLLSIITLTSFFLKIRKKMEKFRKIWNSLVSGKLCVGIRVSIRKTFAQFLRNETQKFSFFAQQFCAKKQQFAKSFAKVISRKIALFCFCETQVLRNSATRVLRNSAIS